MVLGATRIGFVYEQSPWTTHIVLRFAVETPPAGLLARNVSAAVNDIRPGKGESVRQRGNHPKFGSGARLKEGEPYRVVLRAVLDC
jgi:hypothetical protein